MYLYNYILTVTQNSLTAIGAVDDQPVFFFFTGSVFDFRLSPSFVLFVQLALRGSPYQFRHEWKHIVGRGTSCLLFRKSKTTTGDLQ